jgi:hypothetical protein
MVILWGFVDVYLLGFEKYIWKRKWWVLYCQFNKFNLIIQKSISTIEVSNKNIINKKYILTYLYDDVYKIASNIFP